MELFDVVAVNLSTKAERLIAEAKTVENAESIVMIAAMRREHCVDGRLTKAFRRGG